MKGDIYDNVVSCGLNEFNQQLIDYPTVVRNLNASLEMACRLPFEWYLTSRLRSPTSFEKAAVSEPVTAHDADQTTAPFSVSGYAFEENFLEMTP